jgi:hypothetical protein
LAIAGPRAGGVRGHRNEVRHGWSEDEEKECHLGSGANLFGETEEGSTRCVAGLEESELSDACASVHKVWTYPVPQRFPDFRDFQLLKVTEKAGAHRVTTRP